MSDFEAIYSEYFEDVYRYVYALCQNTSIAEEITQEAFFKALKSIDTFKGDCKLRVWLCQIAKNTYYTFQKKHKRLVAYDVIYPDMSYEIESELLHKEQIAEIQAALTQLEEPYQEVFRLRIFGDLSYQKISEIFGKTEGWARVIFHRAKLKLKEQVHEHNL